VDGDEREWRELLGYLLEHHRREARSEWWHFFDRLDPAHDTVADAECIGSLTVDTAVAPRLDKKSTIWRLKFPEQDFKLAVGHKPYRTDTGKGAGEIVALNEEAQWLDLRVGPSKPPFGECVSLVPGGPIMDGVKRDAIARFAEAVIAGRAEDHSAVTSILRKARPRLDGSTILHGVDDLLAETVDAIARMDRTHLVIQGPPGCGKTFTSAHAIVSLLKNGKRVGVTSLSHKAINNLLRQVEDIAKEDGVTFKGAKLSGQEEQCLHCDIIEDISDNKVAVGADYNLIGGTAWLFSRPEMAKVDYLFIDEAGQVSLADLVAMGICADNIVLVGDQMQLSQPAKGEHPGGSGVSALDYLMRDWPTVPADRGVFLPVTWRMHPKLCRFVSEAFYEGRLKSAECTTGQMLKLNGSPDTPFCSSGLTFVAVDHQDNTQKSVEEATRLDRAYRGLLRQPWVNEKGETLPLTVADILVVSPYNMQVNLLKRTLPFGARVGTVDKFQGQEAAVVLVSMASSSADDAPRGIDFLFSKNRLNVALSRARCVAAVFCCPTLLDAVCGDLERMNLVNTVCWAEDYAASLTTTP
ncbi:MAG TPA: AAA domain-containing protein, partial [Gemmatimonadaceae bacterium]|nr:AAA domain-containing protein [Gemmatimonadaceae bacterium]